MSLVNDMLRDLAVRQQKPDFVTAEQEALLQQSSLLQKTPRTWLPSASAFFTVIVLAIVAQLFLAKKDEQFARVDAQVDTPADDVTPLHQAVVKTQEISPTAVEIVETASSTTANDPELQERIYRVLQQAERAFAQDRLTAPIEDNAYRYYQEMLALSPDNAVALEGIKRIADRYVELAQEANRRGEAGRAEELLQRAEFVAPDYSAIKNQRESLSVTLSASVEDDVIKAPAVEIPSVPVETLAVAQADAGAVEIKPNSAWQDQQMVVQADALIEQGHRAAAVLALQQFVAQHPQPVNSALRLFELYVHQADYDSSRLLLQQVHTYLPVVDHTRLTAQLLSAQGQHAAALTVLEKEVEQAERDESYRALLAALYHKTARYQESANHYRRLLESFGEKPGYWLGLALALDALQQPASALEAYRRVGLRDAQPQVRDYVAQRIAALSN